MALDYPITRSRISKSLLHAFVVRSAAPFRRHPVDDLVGIGDVARLAVHAVGRVHLELLRPVSGVDHLVDVRRAEAYARVAELLAAPRGADARVVHDEM